MKNSPNRVHYVITGATSHIGQCLARHLAQSPENRVFTTSRGKLAVDPKAGKGHRHLAGIDLLKETHVARFAAEVAEWAGGPFNVINCVGYFPGYRAIAELPLAEARRVFESNVLALYATAHALLPVMRSKGGGHFIAFSSHAVTQNYPLMSAFSAAKASVDSLIQTIANEHSKDGVVANALAVATLDSPKERALRPNADYSDWLQMDQIIQMIEQLARSPLKIMNGNTLHLYNYSETFFHQSYFERLGITGPK